jgi:hypothetical protein
MMNDQPRRRFRFGLISLLALVAVVGVVACFWNPFPNSSRSNFDKIEAGMTIAEVATLVGPPDRIREDESRILRHIYHLKGPAVIVYYYDGVVHTPLIVDAGRRRGGGVLSGDGSLNGPFWG